MLDSIYSKITSKGWNLYAGDRARERARAFIRRGPAQRIYVGKSYLVLPACKRPRDVQSVRKAMSDMDLHDSFPIIRYYEEELFLSGFLISESYCIVEADRAIEIPHEPFCETLDTLTSFAHEAARGD